MNIVSLLLIIAKLGLAGVFVISGISKLKNLDYFSGALANFKVPKNTIPSLSILIPVSELILAIGLLLFQTAWWSALGLTLLLLSFSGVLILNLLNGKRPSCNCFGQTSDAPISWLTVGRNLLLLLVSGFILSAGVGQKKIGWVGLNREISKYDIGLGMITIIIVCFGSILCWLLLKILSQQGRILLRLEKIETTIPALVSGNHFSKQGSKNSKAEFKNAPPFELPSITGEYRSLQSLLAPERHLLLLFTNPDCKACNILLPKLVLWKKQIENAVGLVVISQGSLEKNLEHYSQYELDAALVQPDLNTGLAYGITATPTVIWITPNGMMATSLAVGETAILSLADQVLNIVSQAPRRQAAGIGKQNLPVVGEQVPDIVLPDLTGKSFSLAKLENDQTMLLFWNPSCGYCQRMVQDVKNWQNDPGNTAIVLISTGPVEDNKSMNMPFPVLLQQGFEISATMGVQGTPSALLINRNGIIISGLAVGAVAIANLLSFRLNAELTNNH